MHLLFVSIVLFLIGCVSTQPASSSLDSQIVAECKISEFRGEGIGDSKEQALDAARSDLAKQINSSVEVSNTLNQSQQIINGKENTASKYESKIVVKANLLNAQDVKVLQVNQIAKGKSEAIVCMSRADAAKDFTERQRLIADSLEIVSGVVIGAEHLKRKNEAWNKTQMLMVELVKIQNLLDGWKVKSNFFNPANETYGKTKDYYANYCQSHKVYWNPEQENLYSEIAFSKLSKKLKIEKSPCVGNGISLVYKNTEQKCEFAGLSKCSHQPSLSIASCQDAQFMLLKASEIGGFHQKEDVALERLQTKLKDEIFWNEWEAEIKQWRPECE